MNDIASPNAQHLAADNHAARRAALACMVTLAVALGIGRFAFTPLLPLMLHGAVLGQPQIDIRHGGWLASFNYAGYFVGAVGCAAVRVEPGRMVRYGLLGTVLLTLAMGVTSQFWIWALVRFVAGAVSAWTFVFASQWGLRRLAELGAHGWSGVIYTGPGVGIVGTGLLVSAAGGYGATPGWLGFGVIGAVLAVLVWPVFGTHEERTIAELHRRRAAVASNAAVRTADSQPMGTQAGTQAAAQAATQAAAQPAAQPGTQAATQAATQATTQAAATQTTATQTTATQTVATQPTTAAKPKQAEAFWLVLLYGIPGFGYIITATFLPVIARHALPGSSWPDLFWPMFGAALIVGALLAARLPLHWDNRVLLAGSYVLQAAGIASGIVWPTAGGFSLGSLLIGLPFTAITLFAMREARRLRGDNAAGLMGYATAAYGIGQIVGPLVAAPIADRTGSFSPALWLAACALMFGAAGLVVVARMPRGRARSRMPDCGCN